MSSGIFLIIYIFINGNNLFPVISVFILLLGDFLCIFSNILIPFHRMEKSVKQVLTIFATL